MSTWHCTIALAILTSPLLGLCETALGDEALPDPERPGPYPVGVTTMLLEDHDRQDEYPKGPRTLVTEIWYPATDDTRRIPRQGLVDTYLANIPELLFGVIRTVAKLDLRDFDEKAEFFARHDARVRDGVFPLLIFSHGSAATRIQSIFWCEHMASHGYLVMAPDHTGNAAVTFIDGTPIMYDRGAQKSVSALRRPKDVSFLIDAMERMNKGSDSRFLGKADLDNIGVAGHSFGGYTAVAAADSDPRVDAIAPMAGLWVSRTNYDCPVMVFDSAEDRMIDKYLHKKEHAFRDMRTYYEESRGPCYIGAHK